MKVTDWESIRLGRVLSLAIDAVPIDPSTYYRMAGVYSFGRGLLSREPLLGSQTTYRYLHLLHTDDFVISQPKAWEGALARVTKEHDGWFLSPVFPTFRADGDRLDVRYLEWYCKQSKVWNELKLASRGIGARRESVSPTQFLSLLLPLPQLDEQRRIVARIEELAARIEEARGLRREATAETDRLARTHVGIIFKMMQATHGCTTLDKLIIDAGYGTSAKCYAERLPGSLPVLRIPNVVSGSIRLNELKYGTVIETELPRVTLTKRDILVVRTNGSLDLVGRSAVVPEFSEPTLFASYLIRLRCDQQRLDSDYAQHMLDYLRTSGQLTEMARTTAGQYNVSLGRLRAAGIPVPPLIEQRRIVAYLDDLQARVDTLKRLQAETAAELDALLPSVLDRAFRGEL
jgi:type I restriction enzyme, S subunit